MARVLLAGELAGLATWLQSRLPGVSVAGAASCENVLEQLASQPHQLLVLSGGLEETDLSLLRKFRRGRWGDDVAVICCVDRDDAPEVAAALIAELDVDQLIFKPVDKEELAHYAAAMLGLPLSPASWPSGQGDPLAAVGALWETHRATFLQKVALLEEAAEALEADRLDEKLRRSAQREAHNVGGGVGTYGYSQGSRLGRELERIFEGGDLFASKTRARVVELVGELRRELEQEPDHTRNLGADQGEPGRTKMILVVDEDADTTLTIAAEAADRGFRVVGASSPSEAREIMDREMPDVVLLDLQFSTDSPHDGTALLSDLALRKPAVPTLVFTASDRLIDRVEAARLGARGFVQKSASPQQVVDLLSRSLGDVTTSDARIMFVDDDPALLDAVRALFEQRGYQVTTLSDPLQFWQVLQESSPDLLILDVDVPHVSGIELCRVVRNDPRWASLPVLFLTAHSDPEIVQRIFAAGADDFVAKPIAGPELLIRVLNRLERVRLYRTLADSDPLTGVANRRRSLEVIDHYMTLSSRYEQPLSLAVLDIDNFKSINDNHGHISGDKVLRRLAEVLSQNFRGEDVVARWGGDEFVVAMYGMSRADGVQRLAEALECLRAEEFRDGRDLAYRVTFSGGVAQYSQDGADAESLYKAADAALYTAKQAGRNRVVPSGWVPDTALDAQNYDVVVVEDDEPVASLLLDALGSRGYSTHRISDGAEAAARLVGPSPEIRGAVVLLDIGLPGLDGLSVLSKLADSGVLGGSRVIVLTSITAETEVLRALELGAFDHVAKPFSLPILMQRIRRAMGT